jgi:hypothetical protein
MRKLRSSNASQQASSGDAHPTKLHYGASNLGIDCSRVALRLRQACDHLPPALPSSPANGDGSVARSLPNSANSLLSNQVPQ